MCVIILNSVMMIMCWPIFKSESTEYCKIKTEGMRQSDDDENINCQLKSLSWDGSADGHPTEYHKHREHVVMVLHPMAVREACSRKMITTTALVVYS